MVYEGKTDGRDTRAAKTVAGVAKQLAKSAVPASEVRRVKRRMGRPGAVM